MIDAVVTPLLAGLGGLALLVATYYVNRFLRRRAARDALEEAIAASVAVTDDPVRAASYVQTLVPEQIKMLGVDPPELRKRIEQRVSSSRSMII